MPRMVVTSALTLAGVVLAAGASLLELEDPTRPPTGVVSSRPATRAAGLQLQSVLVSDQRRVAMIDGQRVQVGDLVGEARVLEIGLSGVRLRRPDGEIVLTLTGVALKRPALGQTTR